MWNLNTSALAWKSLAYANNHVSAGPPRHLPVLRRSMDFPDQGRVVQIGQPDNRHCRESEDCQLQQQASWGGINRSTLETDTGVYCTCQLVA